MLEAIEVLRKNGHYQAALAVARSRLPEGDPLVASILTSWATRCVQVNHAFSYLELSYRLLPISDEKVFVWVSLLFYSLAVIRVIFVENGQNDLTSFCLFFKKNIFSNYYITIGKTNLYYSNLRQ